MTKTKVAVGMSGGVDSSLSALLLQEAGFDVTGVFLECWRAPGCRAEEDRKDALAVALQLGIPFQVLDFKEAYKQHVVEYFFEEYKRGRTPNPDVLCNKEIKFGLFYDWAMKEGFDSIATGHYARITSSLAQSIDTHKDQTYFLYRLRAEQLPHILFPIGHLTKSQVRSLAEQKHLSVAQKPDSQGICFIGEINVHNFLKERLGENPGNVIDTKGRVLGSHRGLWFYTIGQRHGVTYEGKNAPLNGLDKHSIPPFYVIRKNAITNELIVGFGAETYVERFSIEDIHWIQPMKESSSAFNVRIRHTGALLPCVLQIERDHSMGTISLNEPIQGIASGQSAVFYSGEVCLGGGIIREETTSANDYSLSSNTI